MTVLWWRRRIESGALTSTLNKSSQQSLARSTSTDYAFINANYTQKELSVEYDRMKIEYDEYQQLDGYNLAEIPLKPTNARQKPRWVAAVFKGRQQLEDAYPRGQWIEITKTRIRATIEAMNIEEADQISDRLLRVQQSIFHHLCVDDNLRGHYSEMVVIANSGTTALPVGQINRPTNFLDAFNNMSI